MHLLHIPRPIPSEIVTEELERLINVLEAMSNDTSLLKKWYRKDTNKVIKMNHTYDMKAFVKF